MSVWFERWLQMQGPPLISRKAAMRRRRAAAIRIAATQTRRDQSQLSKRRLDGAAAL
jgi:hypothetical protein